MKRLIIFLLLFAAIKVAGQTTGYLRFDTVMIYKVGGTAELVLMNKTKDTLGILTNYGNGRTRFMKSRAINDSTIVVGLDTLVIRGATGGSGPSGAITQVELPMNVKTPADTTQPDTLFWDYGFNRWTFAVDTSVNNKRNDAGVFKQINDTTILHLFSRFGNLSGDFDTVRIWRQYSYDGGRTWTDAEIVIDDGDLGDLIPGVEILPNGDILCVYLHNLTTTTNEIRTRISTDGGQTFGGSFTKIHGDAGRYYAPMSDQLHYLKNGTLFYAFAENTALPLQSQTGNYVTRFLWSTNNGTSWVLGSDDVDSPDSLAVEPYWRQIEDGTIAVFLRTRSGYAGLATSSNNGTSFTVTSLTNLEAPNSTVAVYYDEQFDAWFSVHNRSIGGGDPIQQRRIMDISVSTDMYTWKRVMRLDSLTNFHYIEPYMIRIKDEYLIGYSQGDNAVGEYYQIKAVRIPVYVITTAVTGNDNTINNLDIAKGFNGVSSSMLRMYSRKLGYSAAHLDAGGQTSGDGSFNPWLQFKSSSLYPLVSSNVTSGQQGMRFNFFVNGGTAIANTTTLVDFQNNGSTKFSIFGDGRIRLAGFAGDVTSPANGDIWYNSTLGKWRTMEGGVVKDLIGAGGGSFIASNGATTLTANSFVTQSSFTFGLNEQLLLGSSTPVSSVYLLQLKKVGATTFLGIFNDDNNANGNIVRADKTRAGSYAITATDKVLEFNGNSVATFGLYAGSILGADNFRNLNFQFKSRLDNEAISDKFVVMNDGLTQLFKKGGTGSNTDHFALFQSDLSTTNAYLRVNNGTTGTGGAASFIYTRGLGTFAGYGVSWDLNTTAANAGFDINVHNASTAIADGSDLFEIKNNGSSRLLLNGAGRLGVGVTSPTARLHLPAGTATASTAPLKFTSGTLLTTAEAGAVEFLTDKFYGTITTGAARKEIALNDIALTSGRVVLTTTNGRLTDLAAGTDGHVLTLASGVPTWAAAGGGISGSGTSGRMTFWNGTSSITSDANLLYSASDAGTFSIGTTNTQGHLNIGGNKNMSASGAQSFFAAATYTDIVTSASGTSSSWTINVIGAPTIAATNSSVSVPSATTLSVDAPVAGTNVTFSTPPFSLQSSGATSLGQGVKRAFAGIASGTTNINYTYDIVQCNATSGNVTATLPNSTIYGGFTFTFIRSDASGNTVTINTTSSQTINGNTTYSLAAQYNRVTVVSDGSNWLIIESN